MTKCPKASCKNKADISPMYGVMLCRKCQDSSKPAPQLPEFAVLSKQDRIQGERDKGAKDFLQPWDGDRPNPEFVKAYPEYRESYYTPEQLKGL